MIELQDLKKYKSYLPIKSEKEEIIDWINNLIDNRWKNNLWLNKFTNLHIIRYRFGDKNVTQIYMKNKKWKEIPLPIWLIFTEMNLKSLNDDCWNWIKKERLNLGIKNKKSTVYNDNILNV